jgi:hypothetical protein
LTDPSEVTAGIKPRSGCVSVFDRAGPRQRAATRKQSSSGSSRPESVAKSYSHSKRAIRLPLSCMRCQNLRVMARQRKIVRSVETLRRSSMELMNSAEGLVACDAMTGRGSARSPLSAVAGCVILGVSRAAQRCYRREEPSLRYQKSYSLSELRAMLGVSVRLPCPRKSRRS